MDIYSFINSKSIREYLQKENYKFSSIEAAWLIYQCKLITIKEKHEAWKWLIENMPDCEINRRNCNFNSLHKLIKDYIEIEEKYLNIFDKKEDNAYYQYKLYCKNDPDWCYGNCTIYSSKNNFLNEIEELRDCNIEVIEIRKVYVDSIHSISIRYNQDDEPVEIDIRIREEDEDYILNSFEFLWFNFPTPFKHSDIVIPVKSLGLRERVVEQGPFILDNIVTWSKNCVERFEDHGDITDMMAYGHYINDDNKYQEYEAIYMDLEYYEEPLN